MAGKRDRIIKFKEFLETSGIVVNIGKTKARGNKGFFLTGNDSYRIDIAKNQDDDEVCSVMVHEYAHYLHYKYDKTLLSYDFLFPGFNDDMLEELLKVSVLSVPKNYAQCVFNQKEELLSDIKLLTKRLKDVYPDFISSKPYFPIENSIGFPLKFLLKHDRIKFFNKVYSIDNTGLSSETQINYIRLKSKQRMLKRVNSRINRLNNYYNKPTELISRFMELFFTDRDKAVKIAPKCVSAITDCINKGNVKELSDLNSILTM